MWSLESVLKVLQAIGIVVVAGGSRVAQQSADAKNQHTTRLFFRFCVSQVTKPFTGSDFKYTPNEEDRGVGS